MKIPNGYPGFNRWATFPRLMFVTADGAFLCPDCANRKNGSIAFANDANAKPGEFDDQWRIIGSQFLEAGSAEICAHCNTPFQSEVEPARTEHDDKGDN